MSLVLPPLEAGAPPRDVLPRAGPACGCGYQWRVAGDWWRCARPRGRGAMPTCRQPTGPGHLTRSRTGRLTSPKTNGPEEDVVREHPYAAYVLQGYTFDIS